MSVGMSGAVLAWLRRLLTAARAVADPCRHDPDYLSAAARVAELESHIRLFEQRQTTPVPAKASAATTAATPHYAPMGGGSVTARASREHAP